MIEKQPISQICHMDDKQVRFKKAVDDWVNDEITYEELKRQYPLYPSDGLPWLIQIIDNKIREFKKNTRG